MNLMLIGGGGREHAILRSLKKNPTVETVWMLPGNGAMESEAIAPASVPPTWTALWPLPRSIPWTMPWSPLTILWFWAAWTG